MERAAPPAPKVVERKVVVDAGAAIKLQRIEKLGNAFYTTAGVLREIKDRQARLHLFTLPFEIQLKEPHAADVAFVKKFAWKTGDLGFLSQNDIDVLALTYTLQRETPQGVSALRKEPPMELIREQNDSKVPIFAWGPNGLDAANRANEQRALKRQEARQSLSEIYSRCLERSAVKVLVEEADWDAAAAAANEDPGEDGKEEDDDESDSEGEWVTVSNIQKYKMGLGGMAGAEENRPGPDVRVACVTADYSVQNVLLQIGLRPLTFDGYMVKTVKLWGLICRGCFHFSRDTTKIFCPKCGHSTVDRVPITVDLDGKVQVHDNRRRKNLKGTIYSIPKPTGGRVRGPIFAADELLIGGRDRELRRAANLQEKERMASDPFDIDNSINAFGANRKGSARTTGPPGRDGLGGRVQAGYGRRNPNANNFRHGRAAAGSNRRR